MVPSDGALPIVNRVVVAGRETTARWPAATEPAAIVLDPAVSTLAEFAAFGKGQP
jgi:hypothetical protein